MDSTVNKHSWEAKEKYLICQKSYKFAYQLNLTPEEIDIKDRAIETAKIKKETKTLNQLKNA